MAPLDPMRARLLRFLHVPPQPTASVGTPESIRVFRAGRKYYLILLLVWGAAQVGALGGILFSLAFLDRVEGQFTSQQSTPSELRQPVPESASKDTAPPARAKKENPVELLFPLIRWLEYGAIVIFIVQIPITLFFTRIEYEQHWYIVTDRSLHIRTGIFRLKESTMSFANLQQVEVKQGPLQRLLSLADVRVQSAGGGTPDHHKSGESMHLGIFHGVENPEEIRDLILARLRNFRQTGLGDQDDTPQTPSDASSVGAVESISDAHELLEEVRALRGIFRT